MEKTTRRRCGLSIIFLLLFCSFLTFHSQSAYAGFTKIGVPGYKSYVRKKDKRPVIILVGDSRTMMCTYQGGYQSARSNFCLCWVNGGTISVIGKKGKLTPYVEKKIRRYRKRCIVVLNLGVNGNSHPKKNARRIIKTYNRWMKRYPDVPFYVVSVNPTILNGGPYSEKNVEKVNKYLKKEYQPKGIYIDTWSMLKKSSLFKGKMRGMRDEKHYTWAASKKILKYIRKNTPETRSK